MAKINITKPTGSVEALNVLSAFKAENNIYIVFDSEKTGSMGLPIIYISKLTNKLEKINDTNEWQSVKNYLKGIINGTSFEYIKVPDNLSADESYFMPLTLPQNSFDVIKSRYVVKDDTPAPAASPSIVPNMEVASNVSVADLVNEMAPSVAAQPQVQAPTVAPAPAPAIAPVAPAPVGIQTPNVAPAININPAPISAPQENVTPTTPIMPNNNVVSNVAMNSAPAQSPAAIPQIEMPSMNTPASPTENAGQKPMPTISNTNTTVENFDNDKETFLKACENMFDALVSKYQNKLADLEQRKQALEAKEKEIEQKLSSANEHLANAAAREQVANIAHDNAQKIMDLGNLMPLSPDNNNPTGVI